MLLRAAAPARAVRLASSTAAPAEASEAAAALEALRADLAKRTGGLSPRTLRLVAAWLGVSAAAVFLMVVLGGVTRLTRSGLSMVDWRPQGSRLPGTAEEWEAEFDKYKQFPEYKRVNSGMTLEEFKPIYFMEWFHRMWGRGLGVIFGVPLVAFAAAGAIPPFVRPAIFAALALGAAQGGVGWWMVKSGLEERAKDDFREPRVSPYRLAAHLTVAFTIYTTLAWTTLECLWAARRTAALAAPAASAASALALPSSAGGTTAAALAARLAATTALGPWSWAAAGLVGLTSFAGAFVAGNDAGRAYNDWPMYAGRMVPEQIWDGALGLRNVFENTATVQFDHRNLAYATVAAVALLGGRSAKLPALPPAARTATRAMAATVLAQAGMGIATLMTYVPVGLGAAHQAGALVLLTTAVWLRHALTAGAREATAAAAGAAAKTAGSAAAKSAAPGAAGAAAAFAAFSAGRTDTGAAAAAASLFGPAGPSPSWGPGVGVLTRAAEGLRPTSR